MKRESDNIFRRMSEKIIYFLILGWALCVFVPTGARADRVEEWRLPLPVWCAENKSRIENLLEALDLTRPGLSEVAAAYKSGDLLKATEALLSYYQKGGSNPALRHVAPAKSDKRFGPADSFTKDEFSVQGVKVSQKRRADGGIDWHHLGPKKDREYGWMLNRHSHFKELLQAWLSTGNPIYAETFSRHVTDWVRHYPWNGRNTNSPSWRVMEAGRRLTDTWPQVFYGFQSSEEFTPVARLMMLSSLPDHAEHLIKNHAPQGNHLITEMLGLATLALRWPEFKDSESWLRTGINSLIGELDDQLYPDGTHTELSNHYQVAVFENYLRLANLLRETGRPIPDKLSPALERMVEVLARMMQPNGIGPLNNDGDIENNASYVLRACELFDRPDWIYIASRGEKGSPPPGVASTWYPWAGTAVLRSDWSSKALWVMFDLGPRGTAHQHDDRLNLTLFAGGDEFLVDAGRYVYRRDRWRDYFTGPTSHNILVPKNAYPAPLVHKTKVPALQALASDETSDRISGHSDWISKDGLFDSKIRTTRHLARQGDTRLLIQDMWEGTEHVDALWHFHPDCKMEMTQGGFPIYITGAGGRRLKMEARSEAVLKPKIRSGQVSPYIQGWYSPRYNQKVPAPTLIVSMRSEHGKTGRVNWTFELMP